ncbi:hypothetical protein D9V42_09470 [Staphylococcus pseudoxylosus]|uniref:Uncharacterized protein n=1 Tax=Staphylococcus pseudoxylosus TaxID=2282419 RepID=A0AAQ0MFW4_9STAP|nr:hypothetical protein BU098_10560 [Staphylococcus xylosus]RMI84754.1 hypothetical protein D9V42_09470 [Staphylococcus pseudoxylosus]RQM86667.1 hypothetical protein CO206_03525 [Staphylococcus xylosus]
MQQKFNKIEKVLLSVSLILIFLNVLIVFNFIYVSKGVSTFILSVNLFILSYIYFKKQNKIVGCMLLIIAIFYLLNPLFL